MINIFNLSDDELSRVRAKNTSKNKLGFAILLKYFQLESHYPKHIKFIDPLMLNSIANQLNILPSRLGNFDWEGRSTKRFRQEIREFLGFREATLQDIDSLKTWLAKEVFPRAVKKPQQIEHAYIYFRNNKIEPFTSKELERHIKSAHNEFEQNLFLSIDDKLLNKTKLMIDAILSDDDEVEDSKITDELAIKFHHLKKDTPDAKLKNVDHAILKINCLEQLELSEDFFSNLSTKLIMKYYTRVMAERPSSLREYKEHVRYALFSLFG